MALNGDQLGQELYNLRQTFNDKTFAQLEQQYGSIEEARLEMCKAEATLIVNHFKNNAEGIYQTGSLIAGPNPVTKVGAVPVAVKLN